MDDSTLRVYSERAAEFAERYDSVPSPLADMFPAAFPRKSRILDVGCGSGRDLLALLNAGYEADGVEPVADLAEIAAAKTSSSDSSIFHDSLPELRSIPDASYDGILCSAVLQHLPSEEIFDAAFAFRRILSRGGSLLVSVPAPDSDFPDDGRLFNRIVPEELQLLLERVGFDIVHKSTSPDSLARPSRSWTVMVFRLESSSGIRPIDTIESILNKDAKVATYKLALFRALANIAVTNYKSARWTTDGNALIPTNILAEKWIEYYWPLVEAGLRQTTGRPIAFKKELEKLIGYYRGKGSLSTFTLDYKNGVLPKEAAKLCADLLAKLRRTIWNQPVRYAGGREDFSILGYDLERKAVVVPSGIWNELSLMGTWIQDAAVLRWAELTSRIEKGDVKPSAVLDCLLTAPVSERDVAAAKTFYDSLASKECVWTGTSLPGGGYDLDHAIPFSLWRNNDLWNLLPASKKANARKKDRLPTIDLMKKRKESVLCYWEAEYEAFPNRFAHEASRLLGKRLNASNWENGLFSAFVEAVEVTAIQRGVERWQPAAFAATGTDGVIVSEAKTLEMEPEKAADTTELPFFANLAVACGVFRDGAASVELETLRIPDSSGRLDPKRHFVVRASGDSMDGGISPIRDGEFVLLETNEGGSVSNQIFAVEYRDPTTGDTAFALKRVEKNLGTGEYHLVSLNKSYPPIPVEPETMIPFARFKGVLETGPLVGNA